MRSLLLALAWLGLLPTASAQFVYDTQGLPSGPGLDSYTESLDFGDVDQDGDWDVVFADGGDAGNDQNRIWINRGGVQAGVEGTFTDETALRCPVQTDASRDIEFADFDGDGDPDVYAANNSGISNQTSRFWINEGGQQAGSVGFFVDETAQRWVGLGGPGSSIAAQIVLPTGGFIDWSADGDFADLDNDGDLDLVHASDGNLNPGTPTRLFLNDGQGFFTEFNPSGFQLVGTQIPNGVPALWANGLQLAGTIDPSGATTDVSAAAQDVEIGDVDGDLELDLLLGALYGWPRLFRNLREESGGALGFSDVTGVSFPPDFDTTGFRWDQEFGDLDGDGDLDLVGAGWGASDPFSPFLDRIYEGDGAGGFEILQSQVPDSEQEAEEVDLVDVDGDGDLDVASASFSGGKILFENDGTGLVALSALNFAVPGPAKHDIESADLDGDGDPDLMFGIRYGTNGIAWNVGGVPDAIAPRFGVIEPAEDRVASTGAFPSRAAVYDNVPFELYDALHVTCTARVDGCTVAEAGARHSGAQVFRAELPANLLGDVELTWRAVDEQGNAASALPVTYTSTTVLDVSNEFGAGTASAATGTPPQLTCATVPFAGTSLALCLRGAPDAGFLFGIYTAAATPALVLTGLGIVHVSGVQLVFASGQLDAAGHGLWSSPLPAALPPGLELFAQAFTTEGSAPGDLFACTSGLAIRTF